MDSQFVRCFRRMIFGRYSRGERKSALPKAKKVCSGTEQDYKAGFDGGMRRIRRTKRIDSSNINCNRRDGTFREIGSLEFIVEILRKRRGGYHYKYPWDDP